jgi:hypothetical protein
MITSPATASPIELDDLDRPIWGAVNMAPIINRSVGQTHHMIATGKLDVTQKGRLFVSTPRRLLSSLGIST